ncbi:YjjG family noncanonical pyrimidine nucleotidase [Urechidicola sp. KH5]
MNLKHVFFDLDHTLWDFERNSAKTFKHIFQLNNIGADISEFLKRYESINFEYWRLYRVDKVTKEALRYGRLKDSFDAINYTISDQMIDKLSEDYITFLAAYNHVFEGTFELLDYLKPKYQLHIITNGFEEVQNRKIENSNMTSYFNQIITSEQVGVKKPNPRVFEYALQKANAKPEESIMIGDSFEADIQGAMNCGIDAIFFNEQKKKVEEEIKSVTSLLDIKKYL